MTEIVIVFFCGVILFIYILKISGFSISIRKQIRQPKIKPASPDKKVSLIIPFRNETKNLPNLVMDTQIQLYPFELYEVIFINDHSEDDSVETLKRLMEVTKNIRLIHLPEHQYGKKAAISKGVHEAMGDWIIQTDADCRIPRGFIGEHMHAAQNRQALFVAGPVLLRQSEDLWNQLEVLEFMSLTGSTMGSFLTGKPVMCNGANISYSRAFYMENENELSKILSPSGDDIFLLIKAKEKGVKLEYLMSEKAAVVTDTTGSPRAFLRQRIRWGSKARYYRDFDMVFLATLTLLTNTSILGFLVYGFFASSGFLFFGTFLLVKSFADFLLLKVTTKHFHLSRILWYFPLLALFYYFYLAIVGMLALVAGYQWKGRKY